MTYWTEEADREGGADVIGEDDNGLLWVPSRSRRGWWDRPLSLWRPAHWPYYLRSRRRHTLAFIERE